MITHLFVAVFKHLCPLAERGQAHGLSKDLECTEEPCLQVLQLHVDLKEADLLLQLVDPLVHLSKLIDDLTVSGRVSITDK